MFTAADGDGRTENCLDDAMMNIANNGKNIGGGMRSFVALDAMSGIYHQAWNDQRATPVQPAAFDAASRSATEVRRLFRHQAR